MKTLLIGDVAAGQAIPELAFDATATRIVAGALASRDYSPLHHDHGYVVGTVGQRDIFANTQFQASLFERFLNDWSGPRGRIARMRFSMTSSIFAGDRVTIGGAVDTVFADGPCGAAAAVTLRMAVADRVMTTCEALYALPAAPGDNPWERRAERWLPPE